MEWKSPGGCDGHSLCKRLSSGNREIPHWVPSVQCSVTVLVPQCEARSPQLAAQHPPLERGTASLTPEALGQVSTAAQCRGRGTLLAHTLLPVEGHAVPRRKGQPEMRGDILSATSGPSLLLSLQGMAPDSADSPPSRAPGTYTD